MPSLDHVVRSLLPEGSTGCGDDANWGECPVWPPDVFAVAATLVDRSGCYAEPGLAMTQPGQDRKEKLSRIVDNGEAGREWSQFLKEEPPKRVVKAWAELWSAKAEEVCEGVGRGQQWKRAALDLLAMADEACLAVGFCPNESDEDLSYFVAAQYIKAAEAKFSGSNDTSCIKLPESLSWLVPREVACILPKSLTPEVGCNLRSLSHHLALLPGCGNVRPSWFLSTTPATKDKRLPSTENASPHSLNLLLVPFPYVIHGTDFVVAKKPDLQHVEFSATEKQDVRIDGYFRLEQGWLRQEDGEKLCSKVFAAFIGKAIHEAQKEVSVIHGVVFPEAALTREYLFEVAQELGKNFCGLELIISGTSGDVKNQRGGTEPRNEAIIVHLANGERVAQFIQSKHHRWRLDAHQINRYHLGHILNPNHAWWEEINVSDRKIMFGPNRHEAVLAALVCEDLARFDPVIPVLNAVGPNLVFALLMDGPQLKERWSGRYATVLAEDPGSAVLTLTCLGMVRRSYMPGEVERHVIGLWKSRRDKAIELVLPSGAHALILALGTHSSSQRTLDLRQGNRTGVAVEYEMMGLRSVTIPDPPAWLQRKTSAERAERKTSETMSLLMQDNISDQWQIEKNLIALQKRSLAERGADIIGRVERALTKRG